MSRFNAEKMFYPNSPFLYNRLMESQLFNGNNYTTDTYLPWLCRTPQITTYRINLLRTTLTVFKAQVEQTLNEKYPTSTPAIFTIPQLPEVLCIAGQEAIDVKAQTERQLKEIIVDSCCAAALLRGAHIYAPGVLAMESGTRLNEEVLVFADLEGHCKKGTNVQYESEQKTFIGVGVVRMQRHQLYGTDVAHNGIAIEMKGTISGVPSLGDLSSKVALLQNLPSIVCVRVLDPRPGERILDMCAAPGNKTTHIAELMKNQGIIVALDKSESKIKRVREKQQEYELSCLHCFAYDATKACDVTKTVDDGSLNDSSVASMAPPFPTEFFDRILLDAPCSALGNRPLLTARGMTAKTLSSYPHVQRKLLEAAMPLLKPNGTLVYSTCTITAAENEAMVAWALQKFPKLKLQDATPRFGGPGLADLGLNDEQRKLVQRFGPPSANEEQSSLPTCDTVGFFIAKFVKEI